MNDLRLLLALHSRLGDILLGSKVHAILSKYYSHPKSLKVRILLLERCILEFIGVDKKDKRVKKYKLKALEFNVLTKMFVAD